MADQAPIDQVHRPEVPAAEPPLQPAPAARDKVNFESLYAATQHLQIPVPIRKTGGALVDIHHANNVVRFVNDVSAISAALDPVFPHRGTITLDIGVTEDSKNVQPALHRFLPPLPTPAGEFQGFSDVFKALRVQMIDGRLFGEGHFTQSQPYTLAWMYGVMLALRYRSSVGSMIGGPAFVPIVDALMNQVGAGANLALAGPNSFLFNRGNLIVPGGLAVNNIGGFEYIQFQALNGRNLDPNRFWMWMNAEVPGWQVFHDLLRTLFALRLSINWQGLGVQIPEIGLLGPAVLPAPQPPIAAGAASGITQAREDAAFALFEEILRKAFMGHEGLFQRYVLGGVESLVRPHSQYSEGGLIRKASRMLPLPATWGLVYVPNHLQMLPYQFAANINAPIHLAIVSLAVIFEIQKNLSHPGPMICQFNANLPQEVLERVDVGMIPAERAYRCMVGAPFAVSLAYNDHFNNHANESALLNALSSFFATDSDWISGQYISSMRLTNATLDNVRHRPQQMRRAGGGPLRFQTGILNRFHDPEIGYWLGLEANGIAPVVGQHRINLAQELDRLIQGDDLRNLRGLLVAHDVILDNHFKIERINPRQQAFFVRIDGTVVRVSERTPVSSLRWAWHEHGGLTRAYSVHFACSSNFRFKQILPLDATVQINVGGQLTQLPTFYRSAQVHRDLGPHE